MPEYNKLFEHFSNPKSKHYREDIVIAKINGDKNSKIADRYNIESYPTVVLFPPNDTKFPMTYQYEQKFHDITKFINAHAVKATGGSSSMSKKDLKQACEPLVKKHVEEALDIYTKDLSADGMLLNKEKKQYYDNLEKKVEELMTKLSEAKTGNSGDGEAKKLREELSKLKEEGQKAKNTNNNEALASAEKKLRQKLLNENSKKFESILAGVQNKLDDIQATINDHDLVKIKDHLQARKGKKKTEGTEIDQVEEHDAKKDASTHAVTVAEADSFPYAWAVKYSVAFMAGITCMALYQRLSALDDIIKVIKDI